MKFIFLPFLIMFAIGTDTFIVSPLLPTLKSDLSISPEHLGWVVGAYAIGYAMFAIFIGPLSDGWNRKKVLLFGLISFAASTMLCGIAFNEWSIITFRLLAGICAAMVAPQVWALVPTLVAPKDIVKGMGIAAAGLSTAQFLGVPLGSYLAINHWSTPFFVLGTFSFVLLILSYLYLPTPITPQNQAANLWARYRQLFTSKQSVPSFLAYLLFQIGNFASFSLIGMVLHDYYHLTLFGIGTAMMILGIGNLIGSFISSNLAKKLELKTLFSYGIFSLVFLYIILSQLPVIPVFIICFLFVFTLGGILFPFMMSSLQSINPSLKGTISSLASATMYGGAFVGSTASGWLYHAYHGYPIVGYLTIVFFLISIIFYRKSNFIIKKNDVVVSCVCKNEI
ncbi:MAG: MFS transporter [Bacillota bacterium]|nr:MFS transporter [Bacillota bacterium]